MSLPAARFPDLQDRCVLVTGGGSGIGAAIVEGFVAQGARVAFLDIAEDDSRALVARLSPGAQHAPHYVACDLRQPDQITAAVAEVTAAFGPVGVLVNNAARDDRHEFDDLSAEDWDESQSINLRPHFLMAQAVAPGMRSLGGGSIINFSSIAYLLNMGELPAYAAAKAGIVGLTKSLAGRLGPDGIRVNAILPGMVVTERQLRLWLTEDGIAGMVDRQCLKRPLVAADMVGPCLYLASGCSAGMTAQAMIVDGGLL